MAPERSACGAEVGSSSTGGAPGFGQRDTSGSEEAATGAYQAGPGDIVYRLDSGG